MIGQEVILPLLEISGGLGIFLRIGGIKQLNEPVTKVWKIKQSVEIGACNYSVRGNCSIGIVDRVPVAGGNADHRLGAGTQGGCTHMDFVTVYQGAVS